MRLVRDHQVTGVGIEPVGIRMQRAQAAVAAAGLEDRVRIVQGGMEDGSEPADSFDFIWCRDVLERVESLVAALKEAARVLNPGGRMLVFTTLATDLLQAGEAAMLAHHMGNVGDVALNLSEQTIEDAYTAAGLAIEDKEMIGTEWREYAEDAPGPPRTPCR
jgi:SAM-dependent methyltransferase